MSSPSFDLGYQDGINGSSTISQNTDYLSGYSKGKIAYDNRADISAVPADVKSYAQGFEDGRFNQPKRFTDTVYNDGYNDGNYIYLHSATIEISTDINNNTTITTVTPIGTTSTTTDTGGNIIKKTNDLKKNFLLIAVVIGIGYFIIKG